MCRRSAQIAKSKFIEQKSLYGRNFSIKILKDTEVLANCDTSYSYNINDVYSILVSRRQRAVYVDIGFCVGQIRAQNNYNCDVLFGVGVLFAVYFKGSYWGAGDTIGGIMFSESSPTNLRSSVTVINTLINGVMGALATVISMILLPVIPEKMFGYMYLGLTVPGLVGAIVIMWLFVGETRGLDLKKVTGTEWDKPKKIKEETQEGE